MVKKKQTLPLIPVRGLVVFPYMILHFDVARKKSIAALEAAMANNQQVFLTAQKDINVENPSADDFYSVGTVAKVKQLLKLPQNTVRVLVEGLYRAKITELESESPYFSANTEEIRQTRRGINPLDEEAALRMINEMFDDLFNLNPKLSPDALSALSGIDDSARFADTVAANFISKTEDKQVILEDLNVLTRLTHLAAIIAKEIELLKTESDILRRVKSQIDENQREYYLREQIKAISRELDGDDSDEAEVYAERIEKSSLPEEAKKKAEKELARFRKMSAHAPESSIVRTYLDYLLEMPYGVYTEENKNIKNAEKILNSAHYGLKKVKERILEYLSVKILSGHLGGQILCLSGPPGVGKTSIAKSIAEALGRNYARISLGGVRDEAEIRGHRKTYIGAMPGKIMTAVSRAGSQNALILLDEIDKLGSDYKGDPSSALLEVLDSEQNFAFRDHFLDVPFDLSDVMFITTSNNSENIPPALLDRMEIIELPGYTSEEKLNIASRHLIPKNLERHGLTSEQLVIRKAAVSAIIEYYTREAGVRTLEREIATVCRKAAKMLLQGEKKITVTPQNLDRFLGVKKYFSEKLSYTHETGIVRGLAWTSVGGDTLSVEVNVMDGSGKLELTGKLGDVMKESAQAAVSFIRSRTESLGIDKDFYKTRDIHLHVPEGAVPKDGPSAGITIATAMISALSDTPVRGDIAMTGEITLRGRVLPIGGLTEKVLAAYRYGIKTVIFPEENKKDLQDIPDNIKEKLEFVPVSDMDQVLEAVFSKSQALKRQSILTQEHITATKTEAINTIPQ